MSNRWALGFLLAFILIVSAYNLFIYPSLPEKIPIHWNARGEIDDWGAKEWAVWLVPAIMLLWTGLVVALPWLSPRHFKVDPFRPTFNYIMVVTGAFFVLVHWVMIQAAFDHRFPSGRLVVAAVFLLFALLGNVLGRVRRNFWVGVRTPWTLASDTVWIATHRLAARLFALTGFCGAIAGVAGAPLSPLLVSLLIVVLIPVIYSLVLYKRLEAVGKV